jgi:A/G-specific adenine glycosylase
VPRLTALPARDRAIAAGLVDWFGGAARDLPWRRERRPYAVWVSEVMLQQTRVETVIPYFERFLRRFPTTRALAEAGVDDVLEMWSGLGYYRRARALHRAAREVVERFGGELPANAGALRSLHGVGPYTAGAIASLAFDLPEPLVDGNVARVLARLEGIDVPIDATPGKKLLWATARRMLPAAGAGRFNEALMELGATICTPRAPRCGACPIARHCRARASGRAEELPVITKRRAVPEVRLVAAVFSAGAKVLLAKRSGDGLFGGLWEPPMVEAPTLRAARPAFAALGCSGAADLRAAGRVVHVLTHRRFDVAIAAGPGRVAGVQARTPSPYDALAWHDPTRVPGGVSTLARKILARAGAFAGT